MKEIIIDKLKGIEQNNNVKILYACESGSRAWGFASPDSDYDVRFIYIHNPDYYLSIDNAEDVIELPVNEVLDISGWDIRKALKLFRKSNPPLMEWLQSPIVYACNEEFYAQMTAIAPQYYIPRAGCNHYLSMTANTFENSLSGEQVRIKKYFYALRPVLACLWTIGKGTLPPMEFEPLRSIINNAEVQNAIDALLLQKTQVDEKHTIPPVDVLQRFIIDSMQFCREQEHTTAATKNPTEPLNELFRKYLHESW